MLIGPPSRAEIRPERALDIHYTQPGGLTGHFMLTIMVLMYSTAHKKVRQQCFEAFWYTHHLAFFFMLGLYTHATGCFVRDSALPDFQATFPFYNTRHCIGYLSWRYTIWPGLFYFGERVYREIRARRTTRLSKVLVHPSGAMELRIIKPSFKYTAGQWLFIQVPDVSSLQWHPVSRGAPGPTVALSPSNAPSRSSPSRRRRKIPMSPSTSAKLVTGPRVLESVSVLVPPSSRLSRRQQ